MEKKELLYEGKAKKVYTTENPDVLIVDYKDDATAFNGVKKGTIVGKGVVNNRMTNHIFRMLEEKGIPTHYIEELSDRETAVKKVEIVPLEVIVRNVAAGSFSKKLGIEEGFIGYDPRSGDAWEKAETVSRCIFITAVISETDFTDISFVKTVSQFAIDSLTRISGIVTLYK